MKAKILFPYRQEDNNRNAFAFTIELARRLNSDILALTTMDLSSDYLASKHKNEIYCNLLEMKGYYHGRYNRWNAFDDVSIHIRLVERDFNGAICLAISDHKDLMIVWQQKFSSATGLYEEILAGASSCHVTFFLLPVDDEFSAPSPNLSDVMFYQQKRAYFMKLLQATKIFDLPEDKIKFCEELISQQVL